MKDELEDLLTPPSYIDQNIIIEEIEAKIQELLMPLSFKNQNTIINNIRSKNKELRMKSIYELEQKIAIIKDSLTYA
jgi:hypothetical protein